MEPAAKQAASQPARDRGGDVGTHDDIEARGGQILPEIGGDAGSVRRNEQPLDETRGDQ